LVKKYILLFPLSERAIAKNHFERGPIENEQLWGLRARNNHGSGSLETPATVSGLEIAMRRA
jgi:hypothetical protein